MSKRVKETPQKKKKKVEAGISWKSSGKDSALSPQGPGFDLWLQN